MHRITACTLISFHRAVNRSQTLSVQLIKLLSDFDGKSDKDTGFFSGLILNDGLWNSGDD